MKRILMPRPIVLLDVDGVIADFTNTVRRTVAEVGYVLPTPTEWNFTLSFPAEVADHYLDRASQPGRCSAIDPLQIDGGDAFAEQVGRLLLARWAIPLARVPAVYFEGVETVGAVNLYTIEVGEELS